MPPRTSASTETASAILDATYDVLAAVGLRELSLELVATTAGVSRQTVYRHFGNRHALIVATVAREEERVLALIEEATSAEPDLESALRAAIVTLLSWARSHPFLDRLLTTEAADLLPYLALDDAVMATASGVVRGVLTGHGIEDAAMASAADVVSRLMLSYVINPPGQTAEALATDVSTLLIRGLISHATDAGSARPVSG